MVYYYGATRTGSIATTEERSIPTVSGLDATGLCLYNAGYCAPSTGHFVSGDSTGPTPGNAQAGNKLT